MIRTRWPMLALLLALSVGVIGCGGDEEATPTPTAAPTEAATGPVLTADAPLVEYRARETDDPQPMEAGESIDLEPGANITTDEAGRATIVWPDNLTNELLAGVDQLLSLSQPEARYFVLDQATGTARYVLEGAGEPADLRVKSNWVELQVEEGEADFIVSVLPGVEPAVWVVMLEGEARALRDTDELTLTAGQTAAFTESGPMPAALAVDTAAVEAWYDDVAVGEAEGAIASVAFRCEVGAGGAELKPDPDPDIEAVTELEPGTVLDVVQRDEAGEWLRVVPLVGTDRGWVLAANVTCVGPTSFVSTTAPGEVDEDAEPTETPPPLPTRAPATAAASPTVVLLTATPTRTATPSAEAQISFSVDDDEIEAGECTTLRWEVTNIDAVYLDGQGVTGRGSREVCPDDDTTYTLRVVLRDGSEQSRSVTVEVEGASADPTDTPPPQATATPATLPTNTPPPPTAAPTEPPTAAPTEPPTQEPTQPPPTEEPTDEPAPTEEPTDAPAPTEEPTEVP